VGRFAPSPTGLLHVGSLVTALASFLDVRSRHGRWLLRMEDLDTPRLVPGSADAILRTLERFGLHWDGPVLHQSQRLTAYAEALDSLTISGRAYACDCSRREVQGPYPGRCRHRGLPAHGHAIRFALDTTPGSLDFVDRWQGSRHHEARELGDPVVRRRDGLFAYQLAVVVDDAWQGVTEVVRGADLLDSTPWQRQLQAALGLPHPAYAHVPLVTEPDGEKLAKSRRSIGLDEQDVPGTLLRALQLLGQPVPGPADFAGVGEILAWAVSRWRPEPLHHRSQIAVMPGLGSAPGVLK
jgi:glutamyl-Q tRNA(Asp) synthetase